MNDLVKLRTRGQVTIPKEILKNLNAEDNDFFSIIPNYNEGTIELKLVKSAAIVFSDIMDETIIEQMKEEGLSDKEILNSLESRKEKAEELYAKFLRETEKDEQSFIEVDL